MKTLNLRDRISLPLARIIDNVNTVWRKAKYSAAPSQLSFAHMTKPIGVTFT